MAVNPREPFKRIDRRPGTSHLYKNGTVFIRTLQHRIGEIFQYVTPLVLLDLIMVKKFVGVPKEDIIRSGGYDLPSAFRGDTAPSMRSPLDSLTGLEIRGTWRVPTLHNFSSASPVQLTRALPRHAPSSRDITIGVLGALALYDILFFVSHLAMHKVGHLTVIGYTVMNPG